MKNEHKITVKLEGTEWTNILDEVFKKKNKEVNIAGFRKGKAPKEVYIKNFGIESLYMDAVDQAINVAYAKALETSKLEPACQPNVDVKNIDENHIEYEFTIITKPEVKLGNYKKLGVKKETPKVTKKEVTDEIKSMQSRFAEIAPKKSDKIEDGDIAVIDFEGFVDGVAFEGGKGEDYSLEIGSNTFIPGFESGLIGAKKGETLDVNVTFPENYVENLKGKDAVFKVTVKDIKERVLPELDEEFFKDLGYDDIKTKEELEAKIESHMMEHKTMDAENKYIDELIRTGIENMTVEINDEIIHEEVHRMIHDLEHKLGEQGIPLEAYLQYTGMTMEKFEENSRPEAEQRVKSRYLLDEIIKKEKLDATDEEVMEHAKEQAGRYELDVNEMINMYGGLEVVKYDLLIHKAIKVMEG